MRFVLTIEVDGAAFDEEANELAYILRVIAENVEAGDEQGTAKDVNGNTCARFGYER